MQACHSGWYTDQTHSHPGEEEEEGQRQHNIGGWVEPVSRQQCQAKYATYLIYDCLYIPAFPHIHTDMLTDWFTNSDHVLKAFQYLQKHQDRPDVCEILKLMCPETSGRPYGIVCTSPEFYPVIIKKCKDHVPMNVYLSSTDTQLNQLSNAIAHTQPDGLCEALTGE